MSCRVAGKYVESALFSSLLEKENCTQGLFSVSKTKKNILLRNTLQSIGFEIVNQDSNDIQYRFEIDLLYKDIVGVY